MRGFRRPSRDCVIPVSMSRVYRPPRPHTSRNKLYETHSFVRRLQFHQALGLNIHFTEPLDLNSTWPLTIVVAGPCVSVAQGRSAGERSAAVSKTSRSGFNRRMRFNSGRPGCLGRAAAGLRHSRAPIRQRFGINSLHGKFNWSNEKKCGILRS